MNTSVQEKIARTLCIAIAMCFIGHGIFGVITKAVWCNYFAVFGIGETMAYRLMPWVGYADIALGLLMLIYPVRAVALWLVVWGLLTASLRPLSGEPFAEMIERAGNYGAPLALLLFTAPFTFRDLFRKIDFKTILPQKLAGCTQLLRIVVFLLLAGHGWLNLLGKKGLIGQYGALGFSDPHAVAQISGVFEIAAGISVLFVSSPGWLLALLLWKAATEMLYPHYPVPEWIERGGSYGAILALFFALNAQRRAFFTGKNRAKPAVA
ncbi:MAG: hypothetical protein INR69_14700 [Mucilaginibacter polytrichastri]|nr:hypothetical protein [Mucilaginibacter polytrichastri]